MLSVPNNTAFMTFHMQQWTKFSISFASCCFSTLISLYSLPHPSPSSFQFPSLFLLNFYPSAPNLPDWSRIIIELLQFFPFLFKLQESVHAKLICPGKLTAVACSPDGMYCVAACGEKIYIWQVWTSQYQHIDSPHSPMYI